ncbi:short stature homeobox protein 2 [Pteropus medius]|uniref:short stature homeobox protein 2-like n=1 Tax=Pteropus vampyrus TaxID=132908 RepID=UPI00196AAA24|nr:short stature homeobox protein 2-like [Pteropus giganteus]
MDAAAAAEARRERAPYSPRGCLELAGPRPGLREPEEAEECMAGGGAGGRRRRRGPLRLRRGPRPSPAARRLGPQGPAAFAGAGGEGRRGGSGGSRDCGGAAPRAPSNEGAAAARAPDPLAEALGAASPPGQDLAEDRTEEKGRSERSENEHQSLHRTRSALVQIKREPPFSQNSRFSLLGFSLV